MNNDCTWRRAFEELRAVPPHLQLLLCIILGQPQMHKEFPANHEFVLITRYSLKVFFKSREKKNHKAEFRISRFQIGLTEAAHPTPFSVINLGLAKPMSSSAIMPAISYADRNLLVWHLTKDRFNTCHSASSSVSPSWVACGTHAARLQRRGSLTCP
jgi:hypothetical protein